MARIRTIKPDFWTDEKVVELSAFARLLFIGLWNFADDEGRMEYSPKRIKMQILPSDSAEVPRLLDEIERQSLIDRYVIDGMEYLQINGFTKHQKVDKRSPSKHPKKPDGYEKPAEVPRVPPTEGNGMEGNGREGTTPTDVTRNTAPEQAPAGVVLQAQKPDPKVVATVEALRVGLATGTDGHDRAAELWAVLHANGCRGTASHPVVIEMARDGVTVERLKLAITEARKTTDGQLNPAYLVPILERLKSGKPGNGKAQAWATDDLATEEKARELGLWPAKPGEDYHGLRNRIRTAISKRAEESVR